MEYKRPDGGLKMLKRLYLHVLHHFSFIKTNILTICKGYMACHKNTTCGINPASGTANTRPCNEMIGFEQWCHLWNLFLAVKYFSALSNCQSKGWLTIDVTPSRRSQSAAQYTNWLLIFSYRKSRVNVNIIGMTT